MSPDLVEDPPPFEVSESYDPYNDPEIEFDTTFCWINYSPDTVAFNDTVRIGVRFCVHDSCGSLSRFLISGSGKKRHIEIETKYRTDFCLFMPVSLKDTLKFVPEYPGLYTFTFWSYPVDTAITFYVQ